MIEYYLKKSLNEKIIIRIMYDNKGIITEREIRVTSIKDEKIVAFCYLRNAKRTFKKDKILAADIAANQ
jgi:predicted DNA-binding transcriptional regulator YafY